MNADEDLLFKLFSDLSKCVKDPGETVPAVDILRPVQRYKKVIGRGSFKYLRDLAVRDLFRKMFKDFVYRISCYVDAFTLNALCNQVFFASFRVRKKHRA